MNPFEKFRSLLGWTASSESEFLRFKAVVGLVAALPPDSPNAPLLVELLRKDPKQVTWDEIQAGRIALLAVMPEEMLRTEFGSLADGYETVTGGKPFAQGTLPLPPTTLEGWRAGVLSLIEDLAKFRRAKLMFERARSTVGFCFGLLLLALVLAGFYYVQKAYYNTSKVPPALWQPLLFVGFVGAGFSVLSRLYSLKWSPRLAAQTEDVQALKKGLVINCVLSMSEGVIAAGVIHLLFTSGLLKGDLFPAFDEPPGELETVFMRFLAYEPSSVADVAKLFAWAFVAGFAERLVPDKLNQLAGKVGDAK